MIQDRSDTKLKVIVAKENYSRKVKVTPIQFRSRIAEILVLPPKDVSEMKCTNWLWHYFTTISGHFFANYINIFHKTEVLKHFEMPKVS